MTQEKTLFDPQVYRDLRLKKIVPYNHNSSKPGLRLDSNQLKDARGKAIHRPYTPISRIDDVRELVLLVKSYETGNLSKHIHSLKEGDTLAFKGPFLKFAYKTKELEEVAFIGGGTGIAPFYQVLLHALDDKTNKTKFKLIYSNITEEDILLREELDALKKNFPDDIEVIYHVDKPSADWKGPVGFITADNITKHIGLPSLNEKIKIFVCGPPAQVVSLAGKKDGQQQGELSGILKALGYSQDQVISHASDRFAYNRSSNSNPNQVLLE